MHTILINAYACSPIKGSEPGMAWNWIINLAQHCKLHVITEGEWEKEIKDYLVEHNLQDRIQFYYNTVSEEIRTMCWNQGDWRFYYYYRQWQKKTLDIAKQIIKKEKIDIIHQLNMVGYREPGLLWQIKEIPKVWGPIGGFGGIPNQYFNLYSKPSAAKQKIKQTINKWQPHLPYIKKPIKRVDALIACNTLAKNALDKIVQKDIKIIPEVGAQVKQTIPSEKKFFQKTLKVAWVGKNDERKALPIALDIFRELKHTNIELHIFGISREEIFLHTKNDMDNVIFHGWLPHSEVQNELLNSHLLLFTSLFEATGTVVLEALSMGLPVLCHNTCGQGDIVNNKCGAKVEMESINHSISQFKFKILQLYYDRLLLIYLSNNAIKRVQEISWERNTEKMISIYKSLLKSEINLGSN